MFTEEINSKYKKNRLVKRNYMPQDKAAQKILYERAQKLAKPIAIQTQRISLINYIRFRLGKNEFYGLPFNSTKEVLHHTSITKLPYVPNFISGVINRRGSLITILDLKQFFNNPTTDDDNAKYIIIIESQGMIAGILVDQIEGSAAYDSETLGTPLPVNNAINPIYILGLDQGITAILNIDMIMTNIKQQLEITK